MRRGLLLLSVFVILISACSIGTVQSPTKLDYDKTAGVAIERAVAEMKLPSVLTHNINKREKVSIISMDVQGKPDNPIFLTVNDMLIQEFVASGYTVLERDPKMIVSNHLDSGKLNGTAVSVEKEDDITNIIMNAMELNVTPVDKVVAFRVKEAGVRYTPIGTPSRGDQTSSFVMREARVILTVRIIDPATETILYSKTHEGKVEDRINANHVEGLENKYFKSASPSYPLSNKNKPAAAPTPTSAPAPRLPFGF